MLPAYATMAGGFAPGDHPHVIRPPILDFDAPLAAFDTRRMVLAKPELGIGEWAVDLGLCRASWV